MLLYVWGGGVYVLSGCFSNDCQSEKDVAFNYNYFVKNKYNFQVSSCTRTRRKESLAAHAENADAKPANSHKAVSMLTIDQQVFPKHAQKRDGKAHACRKECVCLRNEITKTM